MTARRRASLIWSLCSLTLCCLLPRASCYEELTKFNASLLPTSSIVVLLPFESCNFTLFVFFAPKDNYSIVAADDTLLADPLEVCLDPSVNSSIGGSKMIAHDYGDYVFDVFAYVVDDTICGNESTLYLPVICAYENEERIEKRIRYNRTIPVYLTAITLILYILSLTASLLLIATYSIFKNLRTLPGQTVLNLAVAFFSSDTLGIVFIACVVSGAFPRPWLFMVQNYFYHSRFVWMAITGFEISRHVYLGMTLKFDSPAKKKRMLAIYVAVGWGLPVLVAIVSAAVEYSGAEADRTVKLFSVTGAVVLFAPVGISVLFNVAVAIFLMIMLRIAAVRRDKFRGKVKKGTVQFSKVFLVVLTVLGFTWIAALLFLRVSVAVAAFTIIYLLLNTTQPIVVAVAFLGNKKTISQYATLFGCKKEDMSDTSSTTHLLRRRMTRLLSMLISEREFDTFRTRSSRSDFRSTSSRTSILAQTGSSFKSKHPHSPPLPAKTAKVTTTSGKKDSNFSTKNGQITSNIDLSSSVSTYVSGNFSALMSTPPELMAIPEYDAQGTEDNVLINGLQANDEKPQMCGSTDNLLEESGGDEAEEETLSGKRNMKQFDSGSSITPLSP